MRKAKEKNILDEIFNKYLRSIKAQATPECIDAITKILNYAYEQDISPIIANDVAVAGIIMNTLNSFTLIFNDYEVYIDSASTAMSTPVTFNWDDYDDDQCYTLSISIRQRNNLNKDISTLNSECTLSYFMEDHNNMTPFEVAFDNLSDEAKAYYSICKTFINESEFLKMEEENKNNNGNKRSKK